MFFFFYERDNVVTLLFFFSSRRRHTRSTRDWSSDVCSSDLDLEPGQRLVGIGDLLCSFALHKIIRRDRRSWLWTGRANDHCRSLSGQDKRTGAGLVLCSDSSGKRAGLRVWRKDCGSSGVALGFLSRCAAGIVTGGMLLFYVRAAGEDLG